jgi:hypothetical protein
MPETTPALPGTPCAGGFYVGRIHAAGADYALIVAPKAEGEHADAPWIHDYQDVPAALSFCDGLANTDAMAAAGSELAKWARGLRIGDCDDWYLPSQDELELCYRAFKPTTDENSLYARSGINVSAVPPTYPYTAALPTQTDIAEFKQGGAQAFDKTWYWSSTQRADDGDSAWYQDFDDGNQYYWGKADKLRARAVRRLAL